jgi:hypothetical protein
VRQHDPFGKPGRAAGVEDASHVFAAAPGIGERRVVVDQRFIVDEAGRGRLVSEIHDRAQRADLIEQRRGVLEEGIVDEEAGGAAVVERIGEFHLGPADVERHHDGAGPRHCHGPLAVGRLRAKWAPTAMAQAVNRKSGDSDDCHRRTRVHGAQHHEQ